MRIKLKTTDFMGAFIAAQSSEDARSEAADALEVYTEHASRPEYADVDLGPQYASTFAAYLREEFSPDDAAGIYANVREFHGMLMRMGLLAANPFDAAGV